MIDYKNFTIHLQDADTNEVQTLSISIISNEYKKLLKLVGNDLILNSILTTNTSFNTTFKLIAFDGIHSTNSELNLQWIAAKNDFCVQSNQVIHIPSNRPLNSSVMLLNKDNRQFLIHHLLGAEKLPFEIVNNSELVIKDGFFKLPEVSQRDLQKLTLYI